MVEGWIVQQQILSSGGGSSSGGSGSNDHILEIIAAIWCVMIGAFFICTLFFSLNTMLIIAACIIGFIILSSIGLIIFS